MKKLLILALFAAVTFCAAAQELTVATYNIRNANRGDAERGNVGSAAVRGCAA